MLAGADGECGFVGGGFVVPVCDGVVDDLAGFCVGDFVVEFGVGGVDFVDDWVVLVDGDLCVALLVGGWVVGVGFFMVGFWVVGILGRGPFCV